MAVYIILFAFLTVFGLFTHIKQEKKGLVKLYCVAAWLALTVLAALRWGNGIDYNYYYNDFYEIRMTTDWGQVFAKNHEFGYLILAKLVSMFSGNIIVYLAVVYGLMYGLLMLYIYKYTEVKWSAVVAFVALDYFAMSFCFMRQGMAMVICLFAFEMIKQRKVHWVVLLSLLAASFHSSALIILLCLAVSYIDIKNTRLFRIFVVFTVIFFVGFDQILNSLLIGPFEKYAQYLDSQFMGGNHILVVYYPIIMFALVMIFFNPLCDTDKNFTRMIPILFLGVVLSIMTTQHYLLERMSLYITIYNIRLVPQLLSAIQKKKSKDFHDLAIFAVLVLCINAFAFGIMNDRYGILPYRLNKEFMYEVPYFDEGR